MKGKKATLYTSVEVELSEELVCWLKRKEPHRPLAENILTVLKGQFLRHRPKTTQKPGQEKAAPLDRYLPQGADPFTPVGIKESLESSLDFEKIQKRHEGAKLSTLLQW